MKEELSKLYDVLQVKNVSFQDTCKSCSKCWKGIEDRKWTQENLSQYEDWEQPTQIYQPWLGSQYQRLRIAVLGINMNEYGGYNAQEILVNAAREEIRQGRRKIKIGSDTYPGTFFWHRLPAYVSIFLEKAGIIEERRINNYPDKDDVANAFDYVAITNSIKCSPKGNKSEPTFEMWRNCPEIILKYEMEILQPNIIIILGKSMNYSIFKEIILNEVLEETHLKYISMGKGLLNGREVRFFGIPHPTSYGGNSSNIFNEFNEIIKNQ